MQITLDIEPFTISLPEDGLDGNILEEIFYKIGLQFACMAFEKMTYYQCPEGIYHLLLDEYFGWGNHQRNNTLQFFQVYDIMISVAIVRKKKIALLSQSKPPGYGHFKFITCFDFFNIL